MSREPSADDVVTRWVDDGPEAAPERFVWAALEQVERTPQRRAWRSALENTPVLLKVAVPVLGAAAVIVLAIFAFGRLIPALTGSPQESPAAVVSPEPRPNACNRDVVEMPTPGMLDVMWCVQRGTDWVVVPFTLEAPAAWASQIDTSGELLYFRPVGEPPVVVALSGPDTVEGWVSEIERNPYCYFLDRGKVEIADGGEAAVIDVRAASCDYDGLTTVIFSSPERPWHLAPGNTARLWIMDGPGGEAVAIGSSTDDLEFADWADSVADVVQTLRWGTAP
jgi:hypothetical protein